jgi:amino acid transporter
MKDAMQRRQSGTAISGSGRDRQQGHFLATATHSLPARVESPVMASSPTRSTGHGFGTAPVFLAAISTILGAVLFLRFGYAVGNVGLLGSFLIIFIGHAVTIPTALAISEIATNRRVEGGGEYFIISRSFGTTIGATIGIALYLSQAVSVAFYSIAFAEAFQPLGPWIEGLIGVGFDPRMVSLPFVLLLLALILTRGADAGVIGLYIIAAVLGAALVLFFAGPTMDDAPADIPLLSKAADPDSFFLVFAIVFPAFTGMTAGVGLSGDLAKPRRSIPLGTLAATGAGMLVYLLVVIKLAASASPTDLATDQLIMSRIALWGPIIPIGLACATISSALGSVLVAPRTLQAIANDGVVRWKSVTDFLGRGLGEANEPRNATIVTGVIAITVVLAGNVDFVARIISMFFMVTYGSLCAISFLEHFAARPSYRPTFHSRWYLSLAGAVGCLLLMFQMDPLYALIAIIAMTAIYRGIRAARGADGDDLGAIFRAVMVQATRQMQVGLQTSGGQQTADQWRPSIIMVNGRTFDRASPLQLLTWLSHRHAVGTYLHYIPGLLDQKTYSQSKATLDQLIKLARERASGVYVDTIISPSMRSALAQSLQVPGISGMENNAVLFEFCGQDPQTVLDEVHEGCIDAAATEMDIMILRHSSVFFGNRDRIHIWLTWHDYKNASLMILLAYMLVGHPDWRHAEIEILVAAPEERAAGEEAKIDEILATGRIPVSPRNVRVFPTDADVDFGALVAEHSTGADLVILGFTMPRLTSKGTELLTRHPEIKDVLFVCAEARLTID